MSACVKRAAAQVEQGQVIFWRSLISIVPIVIFLAWQRDFPNGLRPTRPRMHFARGSLGFALSMSFLRVFIKSMASPETSSAIAFYFGVTCAFITLFSLPFGWSMPTAETWSYLAGAGILGGMGTCNGH